MLHSLTAACPQTLPSHPSKSTFFHPWHCCLQTRYIIYHYCYFLSDPPHCPPHPHPICRQESVCFVNWCITSIHSNGRYKAEATSCEWIVIFLLLLIGLDNFYPLLNKLVLVIRKNSWSCHSVNFLYILSNFCLFSSNDPFSLRFSEQVLWTMYNN